MENIPQISFKASVKILGLRNNRQMPIHHNKLRLLRGKTGQLLRWK